MVGASASGLTGAPTAPGWSVCARADGCPTAPGWRVYARADGPPTAPGSRVGARADGPPTAPGGPSGPPGPPDRNRPRSIEVENRGRLSSSIGRPIELDFRSIIEVDRSIDATVRSEIELTRSSTKALQLDRPDIGRKSSSIPSIDR